MSHLRRTLVVLAAAATLLEGAVPASAALITPAQLLSIPANQWVPMGNAAYYGYTSDTIAKPSHWDAIAFDRTTTATTKVNAARTSGFLGGFDPGTNVVIYQQYNKSGSNLYTYDLDTSIRTPAPGPINTDWWEFRPRISTSYITFLRDVYVHKKWRTRIYIYDRTTLGLTKLGTYPAGAIWNGFVGDQWVTWTVCRTTCTVYVYDAIAGGAPEAVPSAKSWPVYGPTIDEANGNLYYIRSGFGCGLKVNIWTVPVASLSTTPVKVAELPSGIDADELSLAPNTVSGQDLLFVRLRCKNNATDIWYVPQAVP
jgi:hypothetical protein